MSAPRPFSFVTGSKGVAILGPGDSSQGKLCSVFPSTESRTGTFPHTDQPKLADGTVSGAPRPLPRVEIARLSALTYSSLTVKTITGAPAETCRDHREETTGHFHSFFLKRSSERVGLNSRLDLADRVANTWSSVHAHSRPRWLPWLLRQPFPGRARRRSLAA